jgi:hypothetical protein
MNVGKESFSKFTIYNRTINIEVTKGKLRDG